MGDSAEGITMLTQGYLRPRDYKLIHRRQRNWTSRQCICCGAPIISKDFSQREPQNQLELCRVHLQSYIQQRKIMYELRHPK